MQNKIKLEIKFIESMAMFPSNAYDDSEELEMVVAKIAVLQLLQNSKQEKIENKISHKKWILTHRNMGYEF